MNDELNAKQLITTQQKLGRNLLLFQGLEQTLKSIIPFTEQGGVEVKIGDTQLPNHVANNKNTLGAIIRRFYQNVSQNGDSEQPSTGDSASISMRTRYSMQIDDKDREDLMLRAKSLVDGRNLIVHQFYEQWSLDSLEDMQQAEKYLDDQRLLIIREIEFFIGIRNSLKESINEAGAAFVAFTQSEIFALSNSKTVYILRVFAANTDRPDGWSILDSAASLIHQACADELECLKSRYHCKKLKQLVEKLGEFEFADEPTARGGNRILYRIKDI